VRRLFGASAEALLIVTLVFGLLAVPVFAAKGGGGKPSGGAGTGTLSLVLMDGATEAQFGNRVTFGVSTTATAYPYVHLKCSQGGTLVGEARQGFFPTAMGNQWFTLGPSPAWQGGSADCVAYLEKSTNRGWSVLGSTSFGVSG